MKSSTKILCSLLMLAFVGCEDLSGQLNVSQEFAVLVKGKTKQVPVGNYDTSLDFKRDKIKVKIELASGSIKLDLDVPKGTQLPSNGNFELLSGQTGQPFDVLGDVATKVSESGPQSQYESCQYQTYDTVCDQNGCHYIPVTRNGSRYIEFFVRQTDSTMNFDIAEPSQVKKTKAHFVGTSRTSERIITRAGQCF
jgi:hypothetical protein